MRLILFLMLLCTAAAAGAQRPGQPIIDMHLHAYGWDQYGDPPPPNNVTGVRPAARSDAEAIAETLVQMRRHNIVLAVASGSRRRVAALRAAAPERILGGAADLEDVATLRREFEAGSLRVLGELGLQYRGQGPDDPLLEPYWAMAEELDVPVAIHTGIAGPNTPYQPWASRFRTRFGRPTLLEDVLIRHPRLRVYLMHAGLPWLEDTIAMLTVYPQVYVDVGVISWTIPRRQFHAYLRALVQAGFGERIMFGSDQMVWPDAIGLAIRGVESADFLTRRQKRDIFYNNAARFLRLSPQEIAAHHRAERSRAR